MISLQIDIKVLDIGSLSPEMASILSNWGPTKVSYIKKSVLLTLFYFEKAF